MKGLKIIFMLTLVVVLAAVGVFFVEDFTTPVIDANLQAEIEEALVSVYPAIEGSGYSVVDSTKDFSGSGIIGALEVKDGDKVMAVIYTVEFTGFASQIKYLVGVDAEGNITGYQTLAQNDTAGYGAQIADSVNWTQFIGMSIETAGNGEFDGLAGASVTTGKWKDSFRLLYEFHAANYPIVPLSAEEKVLIKAQELAPEGTTVSLYTPTIPFDTYNIDLVYVANDGSDDVVAIYYVNFFGLFGDNEILVSVDTETGDVLGFKALSSADTPEYGGLILEESYWTQFTTKTSQDLINNNIDSIAGSTSTTNALKSVLQSLAIWHEAEFLGNVVLTPEQQFEVYKQELFTDGEMFTDVTIEKPDNMFINTIFDVYDDGSNYLGTIYHVTTIGASYSSPTFIEFLVGIDKDGSFTGFKMVSTTDTEDKVAPFFADDYVDGITGDLITGEYGIDIVAGATVTSNIINTVLEDIVYYHENDYYSRPDSIEVDLTHLQAAYPLAATFESVYENYPFDGQIGNIYAAKAGNGDILGYVYHGQTDGNNGKIYFTWSVDVAGLANVLHVWGSAETWDQAAGEYGDYNGSEGTNFQTSTWLDNFEGVTFQSLVDSPVDAVANVSVTTGPLATIFELIANYHIDNNVGGAN